MSSASLRWDRLPQMDNINLPRENKAIDSQEKVAPRANKKGSKKIKENICTTTSPAHAAGRVSLNTTSPDWESLTSILPELHPATSSSCPSPFTSNATRLRAIFLDCDEQREIISPKIITTIKVYDLKRIDVEEKINSLTEVMAIHLLTFL